MRCLNLKKKVEKDFKITFPQNFVVKNKSFVSAYIKNDTLQWGYSHLNVRCCLFQTKTYWVPKYSKYPFRSCYLVRITQSDISAPLFYTTFLIKLPEVLQVTNQDIPQVINRSWELRYITRVSYYVLA